MPVVNLYVEGDLDSVILASIFQGKSHIEQKGAKNNLSFVARLDRQKKPPICSAYIRDRDFDFEPSSKLILQVDKELDSRPLGWRWHRTMIENYLIDPAIVCPLMQWNISEYEQQIISAGKWIRHYQAGRWTIGQIRSQLPPNYVLETHPQLNDFQLPLNLSHLDIQTWVSQNISEHKHRMINSMDAVESSFESYTQRFSDDFLADPTNIILWFSGKDLLAAMSSWLKSHSIQSPKIFIQTIRDWIKDGHAENALHIFPEWQELVKAVDTF